MHTTAAIVVAHVAVSQHRVVIIRGVAIWQRIAIKDDAVAVGDATVTTPRQIVVVGHIVGKDDMEKCTIPTRWLPGLADMKSTAELPGQADL